MRSIESEGERGRGLRDEGRRETERGREKESERQREGQKGREGSERLRGISMGTNRYSRCNMWSNELSVYVNHNLTANKSLTRA